MCFAKAAPSGFWSGREARPPEKGVQDSPSPVLGQLPAAQGRRASGFKPIEQLRVGEKVLGRNPEVTDAERAAARKVDPATWRKMTLQMTKPDGGRLDIQLLRPREWLAGTGAAPGKTIHLSLPEVGAEGPARVLSVDPCPPIVPGPGQVITGTFAHHSADILDLHITGQDEPMGVTANHRIWSEERREFVPAGGLRPGETLSSLSGPVTVAALLPRPAPEAVFNLEIATEHVYCVCRAGILVHNEYIKVMANADDVVRKGFHVHVGRLEVKLAAKDAVKQEGILLSVLQSSASKTEGDRAVSAVVKALKKDRTRKLYIEAAEKAQRWLRTCGEEGADQALKKMVDLTEALKKL